MRKKLHNLAFVETRSIDYDVAYFLGIMWADGHVNDKECCLHLCQSDFLDIWPVLNRIGFTKYNTNFKKSGNPQANIRCGQKSIINWLIELGYREKSNTSPKSWFETMLPDLQDLFIRGLLDGDGTICIDSKRCFRLSFTGPFDYNWDFLENYCKDNGILHTSVNRVKSKNGSGSNFVIHRRVEQIKFLEKIYNNFDQTKIGFTRKYNKFQEMKFNINNNIKSIGKIEQKDFCKCGRSKNCSSIYCRSCNASKYKRDIPTKEELLTIISSEKRITALCKIFNISHGVFKKWLIFHSISLV